MLGIWIWLENSVGIVLNGYNFKSLYEDFFLNKKLEIFYKDI